MYEKTTIYISLSQLRFQDFSRGSIRNINYIKFKMIENLNITTLKKKKCIQIHKVL